MTLNEITTSFVKNFINLETEINPFFDNDHKIIELCKLCLLVTARFVLRKLLLELILLYNHSV